MIAVRDLQIGDFINTENNGVVQITVLSWRGVGYEGGASTPEHCSYIPLTEDILVKNGFEKRYFDYDFSYDLYEDDNVSFVRLYDHGEGVFFTETSGGDILIKYVHQLQHLLRLCGIEKEVEL